MAGPWRDGSQGHKGHDDFLVGDIYQQTCPGSLNWSISLVLPKTKICYAYWYLSWNAETIPKVNDGSLRHSCRPNLLKVSMKCMLFHHGKSWPRNMWLKKHKKSQEEILHCFTTSKRTPVHRRLNIDWISSWVFTQCHQEKVLQMGKQT